MAPRPVRVSAVAAVVAVVATLTAGLSACGGSSATTTPTSAASGAGAVDASGAPAPSGSAGPSPLLDAASTTVLEQQLAYPKAKPAQVTSVIVELQPGQETGWHKNNVPSYVYVLQGTLTVDYDAGVTKQYNEGTAFLQATKVFHNDKDATSVPLRLLVVYMGAKGVANSVQRRS